MKPSTTYNCKDFCEICKHGIMDREKHLRSEEHIRKTHKTDGKGRTLSGPRLFGEPRRLEDVSPFPGRSVLKKGSYRGVEC